MDRVEARQRLQVERARLRQLVAGLMAVRADDESELESMGELSSVDQHPADVGSELFEQEKDLAIHHEVEAEVREVDRALERVARGTYGTCEDCGRSIPSDRLRSVPATRFCAAHETARERRAEAAVVEPPFEAEALDLWITEDALDSMTLGPEEQALHLLSTDEAERRFSPSATELLEMRAAEARSDDRSRAQQQEAFELAEIELVVRDEEDLRAG